MSGFCLPRHPTVGELLEYPGPHGNSPMRRGWMRWQQRAAPDQNSDPTAIVRPTLTSWSESIEEASETRAMVVCLGSDRVYAYGFSAGQDTETPDRGGDNPGWVSCIRARRSETSDSDAA